MTTVLFACGHNAGRSQMAAAFFNALAHPARARAISAGTTPAAQVHPAVRTAMLERDLDLSGATPTLLTDALASHADWLVTMGCGEVCPSVPGVVRLDWALPDPKDRPLDEVRRIRDEVERHVAALIDRQGWR